MTPVQLADALEVALRLSGVADITRTIEADGTNAVEWSTGSDEIEIEYFGDGSGCTVFHNGRPLPID